MIGDQGRVRNVKILDVEQTTITTKSGKKFTVRPPRAEDVQQLLTFINTLIAEDTFIVMAGKPVTIDEETEWLRGTLKDIQNRQAITFLVFDRERLIANSGIKKQLRRLSHIGIFGITVAKEYRGDGVGKQLMSLVLAEAKNIGIEIATLEVFGSNEIACSAYQTLGFTKYGSLQKALTFRGQLIDLHQMYKRL